MIKEDNEGYRNLDEIIGEEKLDYKTVKENCKKRLKQLAKTKPELAEMIAKQLNVDNLR